MSSTLLGQSPFAIEAKGLSFRYNSKNGAEPSALKDLSFTLSRGQIAAFLGPNGSGKSTCFKLLSTEYPLQEGDLEVLGFDLRKQSAQLRSRLGLCFQSPSLDRLLTVKENMQLQAAIYGIDQEGLRRCVERFALESRLEQRVASLSGGWARRVELAKACLPKPALLLLDEPTVALDPVARQEFWKELKRLNEEGVSIVLSTHLMEEAENCDELFFLSEGRLIGQGKPEQFKKRFDRQFLQFSCSAQVDSDFLKAKFGLTFEPVTEGSWQLYAQDLWPMVDRLRQELGAELKSVQVSEPTMADVYMQLLKGEEGGSQ